MAPEVVHGSHSSSVCAKSDIYSVGSILYAMIVRGIDFTPMKQHKDYQLENKREAIFNFKEKEWEQYSDDVRDFIKQCLEFNVANRPSL